jgi:hypothetical protein
VRCANPSTGSGTSEELHRDDSLETVSLDTTAAGVIIGASFAVVGLLGVPVALGVGRLLGKSDDKGRGIVVPEYSIPANLNLLEAAALLRRDYIGISAELVSLSVRGNIRIIAPEASAKYTLEFAHTLGTDEVEGLLLATLFTELVPGATRVLDVDLSSVKQLAAIAHDAHTSISARGFIRTLSMTSDAVVGCIWIGLAIVEFVFLILLSAIWNQTSALGWVGIALDITSFFVILGVMVSRKPVLTAAGAEQRDYLLGIRDYLQLAEKDRFRVLQSPTGAERIDVGNETEVVELNEKLLPFAVLWGVEQQWSDELAVHYADASIKPSWFLSPHAFDSSLFSAALSDASMSDFDAALRQTQKSGAQRHR